MDGMEIYEKISGGAPLGGAYYLCGEEPFFLERTVSAILSRLNPDLADMNAILLNAPSADEIRAACETLPFFDELRVVTVRRFDADTANALVNTVLNLPPTTILLMIRPGKPPATNPLYQTLNGAKRVLLFAKLSDDNASGFVQKAAKSNGVDLDTSGCNELLRRIGNDPQRLETELLKAAAFVGFGKRVDWKAVAACVTPSIEYKVFAVMDKLWAGNRKDGLAELTRMASDPTESPIGMATLFERNIRLVLSAKQCLLGGMSDKQVEQTIGGHSFVAQKAIRNAKSRTLMQLQEALAEFASIESRQKQGSIRASDALILACARHFTGKQIRAGGQRP